MVLVNPYDGFSKVFDQVVSKVKYDQWEEWVRLVWLKHNLNPQSLLDLACGTGNNSIRFAKSGLEVFGVDCSSLMLNEARKKNSERRYNLLFLESSFLNFNLPKKVDTAICLDFSTNYLLCAEDFVLFLSRVYDSLNHGGIFIFDFKPTKMFKKKEKHLLKDDFTYDWACDINNFPFVDIKIKVELKNGEVFEENHRERGYTIEEMNSIVAQSKFKLLEVYDNCKLIEDYSSGEHVLIQFVLKKE